METRRNILESIGTAGATTALIGLASRGARAESDFICLEVDSGVNASDPDADGCGTIDTTGTDLEHEYWIEARTDEDQAHDDGCKGECCTTTIRQERYDCANDSYYFQTVDSVSVCVDEGYDENGSNRTVPTDGSGWRATGTYKVTVEVCECDEGECYSWDNVWVNESGYMTANSDLGVCGGAGGCSVDEDPEIC